MRDLQIPNVIAHRGASGHAPENTIAAFKKAGALGATWVEFDVMLTTDHELIVFHDETLERTTNGHGRISKITFHQLEELDAGSWFSPDYQGERVPRFMEVIDCLSQHHLGANIELKPPLWHAKSTALKTIEIIKACWPSHLPPPLITSFNLRCLLVARKADPQAMLGLLLSHWRPWWKHIADYLQCVSIHVNESELTSERVKQIKKTGRHVLAYTVNNPDRAKELFSWGVDAVFSDYPERITSQSL